MIVKHHFLKDHGFMLTEVIGNIDDAEILQYMKKVRVEPEAIPNLRELADCRKLVPSDNMTGQGLMDSALLLAERKDSLLALVISNTYDFHVRTRVYKAFAEGKRKSIKKFIDVESALSWLANDENEFEVLMKFAHNKINIHS